MNIDSTRKKAITDFRKYAHSMRTGNCEKCCEIEQNWGLYGYPPEIVSDVLACVATGLDFEAALHEVVGAGL